MDTCAIRYVDSFIRDLCYKTGKIGLQLKLSRIGHIENR